VLWNRRYARFGWSAATERLDRQDPRGRSTARRTFWLEARQMGSEIGSASKVPEVTLGFWIIKIAATTLGETAFDSHKRIAFSKESRT
jgi:hypothetical protein